jgi:hypothetical protein
MYPEADRLEVPFSRGRDAKGHYYCVDPKGGNEGLFWLIKVRKVFLLLAEALMDREAVNRVEIIENSLYGFETPEQLFGKFADFRIRDEDGYVAQQRPDAHFGPTSSAPKPIKSPFGD